MKDTYEKPVVEVMSAEELIESVGGSAATAVTGGMTQIDPPS